MNKKTIQKIILVITLLTFAILFSNYSVDAVSAPAKVTGAKVVLKTDVSVKYPYITWNAVPGADGYEVYCGTSDPSILLGDVTTNSFTGKEADLLASDQKYWIRAYILVDGNPLYGEYSNSFDYFVKPQQPSNLKVTENDGVVKLNWKFISGVDHYDIRKYTRTLGTNDITFYTVDTVTSNSYSSNYLPLNSHEMLAVTAVSEYPTYEWWSTSSKYVDSNISNYATYRSNLSVPTNIKTSISKKGTVTLSWNSVKYADGYQIYNGNTYIGQTSSTKYTVSNLSASKISTLKIRAYSNNDFNKTKFYGNFATINVFPNLISKVKADLSGKTSVKITWNKNNNVSGYKVYRSTSKKSGYKQIANIKSKNTNYYTDKKVSKGKTYYYKVVPYLNYKGNSYNGGDSNISNIKTFSDKKITGVSLTTDAGNGLAYISWKKSSGNLDGYIIYRATSKNGKYKKVKTVSKSKSSYTDKNLTKGQTYYYKIRGYKNINGKNCYTNYSNVKSVKTCSLKRNTKIPHYTSSYYGDKVTIKSVSEKYKKNSSGKAVYQFKMKLKIDSYYSNGSYFTIYFYDKNNQYVGSTTLDFDRKADSYTKTFTWNNVKIPKNAVSYSIK